MAKGRQKFMKEEKAKVKLKAKKGKQLPKGLNVTDTSFKVKQIVIREQLKQHDETEILSRRKLNVKDLLTRLQHYNNSVRQEAVRELKEILIKYPTEIVSSQLQPLLRGICGLSLDKEKDVRRDALKLLNVLLSPISKEQLLPFGDVLLSYLKCAMSHIDRNIKEDSLLFLDVLMQHCSNLVAKHRGTVLPIFLDMISRMCTDSQAGRLLTTTLNSKNTSVKWRTKVLERLKIILDTIVNDRCDSFSETKNLHKLAPVISVENSENSVKYYGLYVGNDLIPSNLDLRRQEGIDTNNLDSLENLEGVKKYIAVLVPLLIESWIEVCPQKLNQDLNNRIDEAIISNEASNLLKIVQESLVSVISYVELLENENEGSETCSWLKELFQVSIINNFVNKFPFVEKKPVQNLRKKHQELDTVQTSNNCIYQNLLICQNYIWFTTVATGKNNFDKLNRELCTKVLDYLKETLDNWQRHDASVQTQLVKVLKLLFLKASKIWYKNHVGLGDFLSQVIVCHSQQLSKKPNSDILPVLSDIVLDHKLTELHNETPLKNFIVSLPDLLLQDSINEATIHVLNKVALQYRQWLREKLVANEDAIIENAKKINIIDAKDEKTSRLTICNLFYFVDGQVYF